MDNNEDMIRVFQNKKIRTAWDEEKQKRLYSIVDVIGILTESVDPRKYWKVLKGRLTAEGNETVTNCYQLKMLATDGKMRLTDVADAENLLKLVQRVPSRMAESFRLWLIEDGGESRVETSVPGLNRIAAGIISAPLNTTKNADKNGLHSAVNVAKNMRLEIDPDIKNNRDRDFREMLTIIERARENTLRAANRELMSMYWDIGRCVSEKVAAGTWGDSAVNEFSDFVRSRFSGIKGFSPQNLRRMRQFYETYKDDLICSTLSSELSWSVNTKIMSCKTSKEREFYMELAIKNNHSYREVERQIDSSLYERVMISGEKNITPAAKKAALAGLRDSYVFGSLGLPEHHNEKDLRKAIVANLRDFILEFGKGFAFVGEEYRLRVGRTDFNIDLLFYIRELSCLVAVELKTDRFRPEHLGQLEFYLEALDRDVKKPEENPSVGLILCTEKDDTVVEYALSRSMSPALVAAYQLHLPDKKLLENKLRELKEFAELEYEDDNL